MPEINAPAPARPTLTQRRTMGPTPSGITKLSATSPAKPAGSTVPGSGNAGTERPTFATPMRMAPVGGIRPAGPGMPPNGANNAQEEKGSPAKIVLWVVLVIAIAVASYFAIRRTMENNDTGITPTPSVTVTPTPKPSLIAADVLPDDQATNVPAAASYKATVQTIGTESTSNYLINKIEGTKYETFTRFVFDISNPSGGAVTGLPKTTAEYNTTSKTLSLTLDNTTTAEDVMAVDDQEPVNTAAISVLTHGTAATATSDLFTLQLKQDATFYLHSLTTGDVTAIALDVKEPAIVTVTPSVTVTGSVTPTPSTTVKPSVTASVTPTTTPTPIAGGNILENVYSKSAQTLSNGLTSNTADFVCRDKCFYWIETASGFLYEKPVEKGTDNRYPSASASLGDDNKLTITVSNLVNKNQTSTVSFTGSKLVKDLVATRAGNTLTYVFSLNASKNYRILYTTSEYLKTEVLRVQVQP